MHLLPLYVHTTCIVCVCLQILTSSVRVHWDVSDGEGIIVRQFVSLVPADDAVSLDTPSTEVIVMLSSHC